jgi:ribosome-associated protein
MDSQAKSLICVQLARGRKAQDPVVLDLRKLVSFADYFVICTARSDRQAQAIAEQIKKGLKIHREFARSVEGLSEGRWVLMDYDDVIVHIFQRATREFYDLEGLWSDAPEVPLPPDLEEQVKGVEQEDVEEEE